MTGCAGFANRWFRMVAELAHSRWDDITCRPRVPRARWRDWGGPRSASRSLLSDRCLVGDGVGWRWRPTDRVGWSVSRGDDDAGRRVTRLAKARQGGGHDERRGSVPTPSTSLADAGTVAGMSEEDRLLIVVRHGDAGDKASWKGPDLLRPLSATGHSQAEGLVLRLADYPVERILCSRTVRCHQTVEPLARDRLLEIEFGRSGRGRRSRPGTIGVLGSATAQRAVMHPRRGHRPAVHPTNDGQVGGRGAAGLAQGLDLAAAAHPAPPTCPLPASAGH
jgi:Histidine phosphatase superfamily (branch 1)